jgi:succinate dehydrogenase hydrophobic anchor subunit
MDPIPTFLVAVVAAIAVFAIFALVFRWIWNRTVPAVFDLKEITFWQAVGILILASILFGGHRVVSTDYYSGLPKRAAAPAVVTLPA